MDYVSALSAPYLAIALVIAAVAVRLLWWLLADFILAAVDLPFREPLAPSDPAVTPGRHPAAQDAEACG